MDSIKKVALILANLSLLLNISFPFVFTAKSLYAEELVSEIIINEITPTPENLPPQAPAIIEITPTAEPTIFPEVTFIPELTPTPEVILTPQPTIIDPTPTLATISATPTQFLEPDPIIEVTPTAISDQPLPTPENVSNENDTSLEKTETIITPAPFIVQNFDGEIETAVIQNNLTRTDLLNPGLSSNKPDYHPTEIAVISGHHFLPNTQYFLYITSENLSQVYQITTDSIGNFTYSYQLDSVYRPEYFIEIKTQSGENIDSISFTDSRWVTLANVNGCLFTVVSHGEAIKSKVTVTTWNGILDWNDDWKSTKYTIGDLPSVCINTANHTGTGIHEEFFDIYAPLDYGIYDVTFEAFSDNKCSQGFINTPLTLLGAITVINKTPPETTIVSHPPSLTNKDNATFEFNADKSGFFKCKLDDGDYSLCLSGKTYNDLSDGSHTFYVQAFDSLLTPDPTPAVYTWVIDTVKPSVSFVTRPDSGITNQNNQVFTVTVNESVDSCYLNFSPDFRGSYQMILNTFGEYSISIENIADGEVGYFVICTDLAGNKKRTQEKSFIVDTQAPILFSKTEFGNNWYNHDQISEFVFMDINGVVSGNNRTCTISTEGLLQTCFINDLNVCDSAGNCNTSIISSNGANIDKSYPIIKTILNPQNPDGDNNWYKTPPEISAVATDTNLSGFFYQWDSISSFWVPYTDKIKILSDGIHTLYLRANDLAGNVTDFSQEIKYDHTDPESGAQNITADPNPTNGSKSLIKWEFAVDNLGIDKYEIKWKLNDNTDSFEYSKTVGAGTTEVEIDQLIEGRWTVNVIAYDRSGRSKTNAIDLYVDRSPPFAPILSISDISIGSVTLSWNKIEDAVDYLIWYGLKQGIYNFAARVGNINSYTVKGLGNGIYYFVIKSIDSAQNQSLDSNEVTSGQITGLSNTYLDQPADGFSPEVKGESIEKNEATQNNSDESTHQRRIPWWWFSPLIIPAYIIILKIVRKKY